MDEPKKDTEMIDTKALTDERAYADRDHEALGAYYLRHIDRMTVEGLYDKSAIAGELAWRDREIDRLRERATREQTASTGKPVAEYIGAGGVKFLGPVVKRGTKLYAAPVEQAKDERGAELARIASAVGGAIGFVGECLTMLDPAILERWNNYYAKNLLALLPDSAQNGIYSQLATSMEQLEKGLAQGGAGLKQTTVPPKV